MNVFIRPVSVLILAAFSTTNLMAAELLIPQRPQDPTGKNAAQIEKEGLNAQKRMDEKNDMKDIDKNAAARMNASVDVSLNLAGEKDNPNQIDLYDSQQGSEKGEINIVYSDNNGVRTYFIDKTTGNITFKETYHPTNSNLPDDAADFLNRQTTKTDRRDKNGNPVHQTILHESLVIGGGANISNFRFQDVKNDAFDAQGHVLHSVVKNYSGKNASAANFESLEITKNSYDAQGILIGMIIDVYADEAGTVQIEHREYTSYNNGPEGTTLKPSDEGYAEKLLSVITLLGGNLDRGSEAIQKETKAIYNDLIKQMPKNMMFFGPDKNHKDSVIVSTSNGVTKIVTENVSIQKNQGSPDQKVDRQVTMIYDANTNTTKHTELVVRYVLQDKKWVFSEVQEIRNDSDTNIGPLKEMIKVIESCYVRADAKERAKLKRIEAGLKGALKKAQKKEDHPKRFTANPSSGSMPAGPMVA